MRMLTQQMVKMRMINLLLIEYKVFLKVFVLHSSYITYSSLKMVMKTKPESLLYFCFVFTASFFPITTSFSAKRQSASDYKFSLKSQERFAQYKMEVI